MDSLWGNKNQNAKFRTYIVRISILPYFNLRLRRIKLRWKIVGLTGEVVISLEEWV